MADHYERRSSLNANLEDPPNSRLFIIGSKFLCENDFRKSFEVFGNIEEIYTVKDRQSGENKGVTYIKYARTSDAAKALEAMNGKSIGNINRSIRVMVAANRNQGSKREHNEDEKTQRLFVVVSKSMSDAELYDYFKQFGEIDYASILRGKDNRESKGFAYVKYFKFSHAAAAFEKCDRKFRPVFAEPRKSSTRPDEKPVINPTKSPLLPLPVVTNSTGYTKLIAIVSPVVNQDQLWKLFDIIPGLDYCQLNAEGQTDTANKGIATIVYRNAQSAAYAKEKLHGFEYPPGHRIIVKAESEYLSSMENGQSGNEQKPKTDILHIAETIAQASNLIQAAGISSDVFGTKLGLMSSSKDTEIFCNIKLPDPLPLASVDEPTVARCFIVCTPSPLPNAVLKNVFSRFGNLIDAYMLTNRNCGFANYASQESAETAINILHGAEICGMRIKVLKAEEKQDQNRKRQRLEDKF